MDMILAKHRAYPLILVEEIKLTSSYVKYPIVLQRAFAIGVLTSKRGVGCRGRCCTISKRYNNTSSTKVVLVDQCRIAFSAVGFPTPGVVCGCRYIHIFK